MTQLLARIVDAAPASIGAAVRKSILDEQLNSPEDVVVVRDLVDGRYRCANPRLCELLVNQPLARMLGYEPEEMVSRATTSFVPPDEHAAIRAEAARLLEGNEVARRAVRRLVHRDGRLVPVSVTSAPCCETRPMNPSGGCRWCSI